MREPHEGITWEDAARTAIWVDLGLHGGRTVTAEEWVAPMRQAFTLAEMVPHTVNLLIDARQRPPVRGVNWLTLFRHLNETRPPNLQNVIVLGAVQARLYVRVLATLRRVQPVRGELLFAASLEEAHALLGLGEGTALDEDTTLDPDADPRNGADWR